MGEHAPEPEVPDLEARIGEKILGPPEGAAEEPEAPEAPAAEPEPAEPELPAHLQGKTAAEIAHMHAELERKLGQQSSELGDLRRRVEQYEQPAEPDYRERPLSGDELGAFDRIVEEDPEQAARLAVQVGNEYLYERAIQAWADEDEFAALRFDHAVQLEQRDRRLREEMRPVVESDARTRTNQQWAESWQRVRAEAPDIDQYAQAMQTMMRDNPTITQMVVSAQTPEQRDGIARFLYHAARSLTGAPIGSPTGGAAPTPAPPHVASGETGRQNPAPAQPLDVVQHAIRMAMESEPSIEAGLSS